MARKKENKRSDGYYEFKCVIGHDIDGKGIYKSFYSRKSKADARLKAEQYKLELTNKNNAQENISFSDWADIFLAHQKEKVKLNTYMFSYENIFKNHLIPFFKNRPLKSIIKTDIEDYANSKLQTHASTTVAMHISKLSKCFTEAIDNGYVDYNPCRNVHIKQKTHDKRIYTEDQVEKILDFCKNDKFGLCVHLMLSYGMSRSELLGITYDDVDFENLTISINKGLTAKSARGESDVLAETKNKYRNRIIAISQETADFIKSRVQYGFLANPNTNKLPTVCSYKDRHKAFMKRMHAYYENQGYDIPMLNPHELRHTRASLWVNQGKNLFAIAEMLGWSDLHMLRKVYGHADIQQLRKELEI